MSVRDCLKCRNYSKCKKWDCLKDPNECEFFEEWLTADDLVRIDSLFRRFYEMELEELERILKEFSMFSSGSEIRTIQQDCETWRKVRGLIKTFNSKVKFS